MTTCADCLRPAVVQGYCRRCYQRRRRRGEFPSRPACHWCSEPAIALDRCYEHLLAYWRNRRCDELPPLQREQAVRSVRTNGLFCTVRDCTRLSYRNGLCHGHQDRYPADLGAAFVCVGRARATWVRMVEQQDAL